MRCKDVSRKPVAGSRRAGRSMQLSGYRLPVTGYRASRGFTLIELVAAFVIFALGFGILLQILTGALRTTTQSADNSQAEMWAQSLLDP